MDHDVLVNLWGPKSEKTKICNELLLGFKVDDLIRMSKSLTLHFPSGVSGWSLSGGVC